MRRAIRFAIRLMAAGQIADGATFLLVAGSYGVDGESNPIVRFLWNLGFGGFFFVVFMKLLLIWYALTLTKVMVFRGHRALALILLAFCAILGLVGAISNVWSFLILSGGK